MKRTLQEMLDYAEECMDVAGMPKKNMRGEIVGTTLDLGWQQQSIAASTLAHAVALASAIKYKVQPEEVDLSE